MKKASVFLMIMMAWVLWSEKLPKKDKRILWFPKPGFETEAKCDIEINWRILKALERKAKPVGTIGYRDALGTTIMHCYPQTFDPRPR